ncbi:tRNA (adenosine(37)-N6)-dimethylallyltransferase MiaA [Sneathiella sp. P13V-1]|uniref:tRNA (adenosine(37)-N6)-dimethylallyltransferase MiaA n=1 Tax=Sneathiella sp. P13V-1 TaxID=2697366 RepID=UPI00187B33EC|nr:tRNA (adenosine(37)-N6)-dimethylallyltransferase MiaA [Sneathiella sp. P13V-1]MBE7637885.1 tRNA (adenosine(37)-N6)-dimethylallyltransferase MiaA [Sneathiella sp. P13V-1]
MAPDQHTPQNGQACILLAGPTASGKSALAISIAKEFNGVVINGDSMQVYDGLRVITARPSEEEEAQCPHRLYGVLDPSDFCSAARWRDMALAEIHKCHEEGTLPIVVGGTGLYFEILTKGIAEVPEITDEVRGFLRDLQKREGNEVIYKRLQEKDPESAEKLNLGDTQRLLRALEVVEQTGVPLGEWHRKSPEGLVLETPYLHLALTPDREWLYDRCNRRLDWMIEEGGAIEEVRDILKRDLDPALPAMKALGVPEIADYLAGNLSKEAMLERIKMMTRRYAKRQMTWVRNKMNAAITSSAQDLESFEAEFFPFIRRFLLTHGK